MGQIFKKYFPEFIKQRLRRVEDFFRRSRLGHLNDVILEDSYAVKFILHPYDRNPIRWQLKAGTNKPEFDEIAKIIKKDNVVFDVGANIGLISAFMGHRVGTGGTVYAFEPQPETRKELQKTIALNELENVVVAPYALSSEVGTADLYFVNNNKLSSLAPVGDNHYGTNKTVRIATNTIDNFCSQNNVTHIDFIKIDVEGFEYEVLIGAREMLQKHAIKAIQFEMRERNQTILDMLQEYGYRIDHTRTNFLNHYAFI